MPSRTRGAKRKTREIGLDRVDSGSTGRSPREKNRIEIEKKEKDFRLNASIIRDEHTALPTLDEPEGGLIYAVT